MGIAYNKALDDLHDSQVIERDKTYKVRRHTAKRFNDCVFKGSFQQCLDFLRHIIIVNQYEVKGTTTYLDGTPAIVIVNRYLNEKFYSITLECEG